MTEARLEVKFRQTTNPARQQQIAECPASVRASELAFAWFRFSGKCWRELSESSRRELERTAQKRGYEATLRTTHKSSL